MERQKGELKKFFSSKKFLIVGIGVLFFFGFIFSRAYYKNYLFKQEVREREAEYQKLLGENGDLKILLEKVKSPAYAEQVARSNFGLVKPGENQITIIKDAGKNDGQTKNNVVESVKLSNPLQWWNYFFKHN